MYRELKQRQHNCTQHSVDNFDDFSQTLGKNVPFKTVTRRRVYLTARVTWAEVKSTQGLPPSRVSKYRPSCFYSSFSAGDVFFFFISPMS